MSMADPDIAGAAPDRTQPQAPAYLDPTSAKAMLMSFRTHRWRWYWALLATLIGGLLAIFLLAGSAALISAGDDRGDGDALLRPGHLPDYVMILVAWGLLATTGLLALRFIKGDPLRRAFTSTDVFPLADLVKTAIALFIVYCGGAALTYVFTPEDFARPLRAPGFYNWLALGLFVILVQSAAEEIFFRGFLFRVWGAVFPYPFVAPALIMTAFISLHIPNPDMQRDIVVGLSVFIAAEIIAYAALLRTKSLAATIGLHWANNVYAFFLVATAPAGDTDAAIFIYTDPVYAAGGTHTLDPAAHAVNLAGVACVVALLFWERSPFCLPKRAVIYETEAAAVPRPSE